MYIKKERSIYIPTPHFPKMRFIPTKKIKQNLILSVTNNYVRTKHELVYEHCNTSLNKSMLRLTKIYATNFCKTVKKYIKNKQK